MTTYTTTATAAPTDSKRPFSVTCRARAAAPAWEGAAPEKSACVVEASGFSRYIGDLANRGKFWLPAAAEKLNISPNIRDYILVPVVSMPSDLPNTNGMAFPLEQLTEWHTDEGRPAYESWTGKPLHVEHVNHDPSQAKGIIFDTKMRPMPHTAGDIWKVVKLVGVDRTRDPVLANDILSGRKDSYSMGANAADFQCSVCSALASAGGCGHVTKGGNPTPLREFNGVLAFKRVIDPVGFEISSVGVPAYKSASGTKALPLWD